MKAKNLATKKLERKSNSPRDSLYLVVFNDAFEFLRFRHICNGTLLSGPLLSVDYGLKRIGLAVSDRACNLALPHGIIKINNESDKLNLINNIISVIDQTFITVLVVGYPLSLNYTRHSLCDDIDIFVKNIQLKKPTLDIILLDERFSTQTANKAVMECLNKGSKTFRKDANNANRYLKKVLSGNDDSRAATVILDNFINIYQKNNT